MPDLAQRNQLLQKLFHLLACGFVLRLELLDANFCPSPAPLVHDTRRSLVDLLAIAELGALDDRDVDGVLLHIEMDELERLDFFILI
jgi:hypothetical protein